MKCTARDLRWAGILLGFLIVGKPAAASTKLVNVQGKLTDTSGNPLTGSQTITFRLYTSSTAAVGTAFWTESQTLTLSTGLFNATLGNVTSLDSTAFNQLYYLGIQVSGDANELSPRQQLGASPYSQGSLGDFNAGNNIIVGSSLTVGGTSVTGSSITASAAFVTTLTASSVTTSGNATIGGQETISGQLIVVGTAMIGGGSFSVAGSTFVVSAGSVTLGGRLNASSAGIKWADGTTSTTSIATGTMFTTSTDTITAPKTYASSVAFYGGVYGNVDASTTVFLNTGTAMGTTQGPWPDCLASSTATITITGNCIQVLASGSWLLPQTGYNYGISYRVNGAMPVPYSEAKRSQGAVWEQPSANFYIWPWNIDDRVCGLSPGTVSVCITASGENAGTIAPTSGTHTPRNPTLSIIEVK